ncbi:hypothetical protein RGF97_16810 [Streptomyces roseicoloratus]|uniref:Uncharacterized protein n=1 Tax=Streptomyces roseicoloratus TaxID=2508722 RepID=A0ABY9RYA7_9ACTN|nr:hypothetical protein [Streptomyces roseicoloratus]WMX46169.1 hypothetical protein RGF97_16810 [Streptomyces roseicoloratus]
MSDEEVGACLAAHLHDLQAGVLAAWPADQVAARVTGAQLISAIGDLWYPAMDDLVIIDLQEGSISVLVLDHEERFMAARLPGQAGLT